MNERGLFSSDQMVYPLRADVEELAEDEIYIWDAFYSVLQECSGVDEVVDWIGDRRLVQYPTLPLHNLYADPGGNAMVVEAGVPSNVITKITGSFLAWIQLPSATVKGVFV